MSQRKKTHTKPKAPPAPEKNLVRYRKHLVIIILCFIVGIGAFLRFDRMSAAPPGLSPDEAMEGNNAMEALESHNFQVFYAENNGREGLYANAAAVSIALFGNTKAALRIPAAVAGTLTVVALYCLATEVATVPVALAASFLVAVSFWHIVASRMAGHAILAPLFLTWALYCFVRILRGATLGAYFAPTAVIGGICYGLGFTRTAHTAPRPYFL